MSEPDANEIENNNVRKLINMTCLFTSIPFPIISCFYYIFPNDINFSKLES